LTNKASSIIVHGFEKVSQDNIKLRVCIGILATPNVVEGSHSRELHRTIRLCVCRWTERVAVYKQLRGGIEFVSTLPRTISGKILRRNLSATFQKSDNAT